uniref:DUF4220 domain-containing protein n=1 Tax=Heterorhabditis bacteriophora TaxID=37862 RepID=A0A1I7X6U8_HETBA
MQMLSRRQWCFRSAHVVPTFRACEFSPSHAIVSRLLLYQLTASPSTEHIDFSILPLLELVENTVSNMQLLMAHLLPLRHYKSKIKKWSQQRIGEILVKALFLLRNAHSSQNNNKPAMEGLQIFRVIAALILLQEHMTGADLYTTVILGLFALIIILLMFRSIKPTETLDDQKRFVALSVKRYMIESNVVPTLWTLCHDYSLYVFKVTLLLCSMQMRVDYEESVRQKKKMKNTKHFGTVKFREAKFRAQLWLNEIKSRGIRKLSKRGRSTSFSVPRTRDSSICSVPTPIRFSPFTVKPPLRAKSYQGKLPAIVVEDEKTVREQLSVSRSRPISRSIDYNTIFKCFCRFIIN